MAISCDNIGNILFFALKPAVPSYFHVERAHTGLRQGVRAPYH
jgi:hypothetical protein